MLTYPKSLEEPAVPVADLVEVEKPAIGAVEIGNSLAFVGYGPLEEISWP